MTRSRLDPMGKQALFDAPVASAADRIAPGPANQGKAALFSNTPRRPGTVVVECSGCKVRTRASLANLALRLALGSAWFPLRPDSHWLRCPGCGQWRWCRIGWTE
jgi:hypothetical protein